jgi:hypothetical protein
MRQGSEQWAVRESSLSTHNYYGKDIAVDPQGDVFVCGYGEDVEHLGQGDSQEYVTIRYTSQGAVAGPGWPAIYNRTQGHDRAVALALRCLL